MTWSYNDDRNRIVLDKLPKQKLRVTGHRLSTVLGLNKYATPFQAWCEITKSVKVPFVENKYIILGRYAEPKIIDYVRDMFPNVMSMEEYYGNAIDEYRYNNFKYDSKIFGGMFDFVCTRDDKKTIALVGEIKTTGTPQKFDNDNIPVEYLLQAALYARLKKLNRVLFVVSFATEEDYMHPENFKPTKENTKLIVKDLKECVFEINGEYYDIDGCMKIAEDWWNKYILTGISPKFDEKLDKEYLDILRSSKPTNDTDLVTLCEESLSLAKEIKTLEVATGIKGKKDELKILEACIKEKMIETNMDICDKYKLKCETKSKFNEKLFAEKHKDIYDKFCETVTKYTLTKDMKEEGD